jgi:hypothetical protein
MRVSLNHIQTRPAAKFLFRSQVNPNHDEPARERMLENMRRDVRQFNMPAGGFKGRSET